MGYGSVSGVAALIPGIGDINTTSTPTEAQVSDWLDQGYSRINRVLSNHGYVVPVDNTSLVYEELTALNNMYAQVRVLRARGLDNMQGVDQNKAEMLQDEFDEELMELAKSDLVNAGVTVAARAAGIRRRRIRTLQMRRIDGYSGEYEGEYDEYDEVSD